MWCNLVFTLAIAFACALSSNALLPEMDTDLACPKNSQLIECGQFCEPSCRFPSPVYFCHVNREMCTFDCRCVHGYVRNLITQECVKLEHCTKDVIVEEMSNDIGDIDDQLNHI